MKKTLLFFMTQVFLWGGANIPAGCETPGECPNLAPKFTEVTVKEELHFADSNDTQKSLTMQAAKGMEENVTITLPAANGQPDQVLVTDASGRLTWTKKMNVNRLLGMITFMQPDNDKGIYLLNGQVVYDEKLAEYITDHNLTGFDVNGSRITLPNWQGRYLGATGGLGIGDTPGVLLNDQNKRHTHTFFTIVPNDHVWVKNYKATGKDRFNTTKRNQDGSRWTTEAGEDYFRPKTIAMPLVIIGSK